MVKIKLPTPLYIWLLSNLHAPMSPSITVNITMQHGVTTYRIEPKDASGIAGRTITHLDKVANG